MDVPQPTHREMKGVRRGSLTVGQVINHETRRTVTDFDNIAAALLAMNTHPMHSDYDFAARSQFKKPLVVSPFLLSCLVAAVMNDMRELPVSAFDIQDLSFIAPVHPGDTISARSLVESADSTRYVLAITGAKADGTEFAKFSLVLQLQETGVGRSS